MPEAVIFDMDGVIVDTEPGYFYAVNDYLSTFGISISQEFNRRLIGVSYSHIWELLNKEYHLDSLTMEAFIAGMERCRKKRIAAEGYIPVPGTLELIEELHQSGILLAIASSSPSAEIGAVMDAVNIRRYINAIVSAGDECEHGKPNPEVFLKAACKLCVKPEACLVIEDAAPGILAAKRAGMHVIGYQSSFGGQDLRNADIVVSSMTDITPALCRKLLCISGRYHP